eukprot:SAG11_NODE_446_length_9395_cov_19.399957_6_plen_65_part_00
MIQVAEHERAVAEQAEAHQERLHAHGAEEEARAKAHELEAAWIKVETEHKLAELRDQHGDVAEL